MKFNDFLIIKNGIKIALYSWVRPKLKEFYMKKIMFFYTFLTLLILVVVTCTVPNTGGSSGGGGGGTNSTSSLSAGDKKVYSAAGINYTVIYVPGKTFKTGVDDSGTATVSNPYWIAETSVTYELWSVVYAWATISSTNVYKFADPGVDGDGTLGESNQHPVTTINWRDAMVWTNALTEWYNSINSTSLTPVYKSSGTPLRDSTNVALCDAAVPDSTATGFRLLTSNEWELAARYINDSNNDGNITGAGEYYPGNHASGDTTGYCYDNGIGGTLSTIFGNYAWYVSNSTSTNPVKNKLSNALGIYDMSGNVWQWCFDLVSSTRVIRGGSWFYTADGLQVGYWGSFAPTVIHKSIGFRISINS